MAEEQMGQFGEKMPSNELEASEALIDRQFSVADQELLVSMVEDPEQSMYVLTIGKTNGRQFTLEQTEKLMRQIESDPEQASCLYENLVGARDAGVELDEIEIGWLERLEK